MDISPNWVEETRAFQWFHLAVDPKSSVWSLLGWQREAAGCEHSTQVSPCSLPMSSWLTGSLQSLCQPDTARTCWLHMCAQARGIFGCCNLHSSSVGAMLINLLSLCEVYLVLLTREETAISRQHRQMFFFFHRLQISPEFSENVSGSHANCAQKSHLKHFCPCTENFVRMLSESIQLGRRWVCIISTCTPVLLPACPSVTLWGKSCLHSTPSSEVFHRNYTLKLPILVTQQLTPFGDQEADFNRHKQEWGAHIFLMLETWLLYIWISTACPRS